MSRDATTPDGTPSRFLSSLASLAFAVQSAFDTRGLVTALGEHVLEIARADGFVLLLLDYETGELEGTAFERGSRGAAGHVRLAPGTNGFLERVLRRETLVADAGPDASACVRGIPWTVGPFQTIVGVPILIGTSLLGVALLGYGNHVAVTDRRRRALLFLADQIGLAVDRIRTRTDLETRARELDEARASLRRIDEAKSDLISIVSHELRTPLTAIKAYTEALLDNADQSTFPLHAKFLGIIDEECDRLARMVNDVLDLSRMDSGRRRLKAEPIALTGLVEDVLPTVEPGLKQRGLALRVRVPDAMPAVEADADLLKQILVNLIHNAIKFSRPVGEVSVIGSAEGDRVRIVIEDQGIGISAEQLARVFDRFYRIEGGTGERVGGTGLGLAIVKRAVELHGGTVHVESEVGTGSRFVVDLPREQLGFRNLILSLGPFFEQPDLRGLLQNAVEMIAEVMDARIVSLMFYNEDASELVIQAAHGLDPDMVNRTRVRTGDSIAGWVAQTSERLLVRDIESDRRFRKMNHPQYETKSLLCVPFRIAGETVGVVNVNNKRNGLEFDTDDLNLLAAVMKRVGAALERVRGDVSPAAIEAMVGTIRAIVRTRRNHMLPGSRRALKLAIALGRRVGLEPEELELLGYVMRVHDVGMLTIEDGLLFSARRWSEEERRHVEGHPAAGVQMLRPLEFASKVNEIILGHHEHWDGAGYPRGLAREQIPLASRVLAVVDAFESMTTGRPYREPYGEAEAVLELRRCSGTQFDPKVVDELCLLLAEDRSIAPTASRRDLDASHAPGSGPETALKWGADADH
jgi:signal transduction histidine kinase/HD-GYP domain-containing protein (c-di-GMP phosphodiesterase class II)